jgi:hypothetical protein
VQFVVRKRAVDPAIALGGRAVERVTAEDGLQRAGAAGQAGEVTAGCSSTTLAGDTQASGGKPPSNG